MHYQSHIRQLYAQDLGRRVHDLVHGLQPYHGGGSALAAPHLRALLELLDNLLDNALRYTPGGRAVTVRCGVHLGRPYLSVEDTGPGIPEAAHGRVLERFYRIQGTPGDGAGLGLAIVNEVAQKHQATLQIESPDGSGSGTRIVIRFPATAFEIA